MSRPLLSILLLVLSFISCKDDDGDTVTRVYNLSNFHTINLDSSFDVFLMEDSTFSLEVVAKESSIKKLNYSLTDSILSISNDRRLKWTSPKDSPITLYIKSKPLKRVNANETCHVRTLSPITSDEFGITLSSKANEATLELDCRVFFYWNNFPTGGKLSLSGKAEQIKIWNTALLSVDAKNLIANYALVENESKGTCEINVVDQIDYRIKGSGDIHVYGSPTTINDNGSASTGKFILF